MQTCGSPAPSPVWGGLNVGFHPRGMGGSRLQRKSAIRPSCRNVHDAASVAIRPWCRMSLTALSGPSPDLTVASVRPARPDFCYEGEQGEVNGGQDR
jgi:hypothetical protein